MMTAIGGGPYEDPPYPSPGVARYILFVLLLAWISAFADRLVINLLLPAIRHDMHISDTVISLTQGIAFTLFYSVAAVPIGAAIDRWNRRNLLLAGIALWGVMTIACGLATNFGELFAARVGLGVGEACLVPGSISMLADCFPPQKRGRAIGLAYMGAGMGSALSVIGGGTLLKVLGDKPHWLPIFGEMAAWRIVFLLLAIPALIVAAMLLTIREPARRGQSARASSASDTNTSLISHLTANRRAFIYVLAASAMVCSAAMALSQWGAVFLMRRFLMSPAEVSFPLGLVMLVSGPLGAPVAGHIADRLIRRRPLDGRWLMNLIVIISIVFTVLMALAGSFWIALLAQGTALLVLGAATALAFTLVQDITPGPLHGRTIAVYQLLVYAIGGTAPTLTALITDNYYHQDAMVGHSLVIVVTATLGIALAMTVLGLSAYRASRLALLKSIEPAADPVGAAAGPRQNARHLRDRATGT